jgi:hypothetical protein
MKSVKNDKIGAFFPELGSSDWKSQDECSAPWEIAQRRSFTGGSTKRMEKLSSAFDKSAMNFLQRHSNFFPN